MDISLNCKFNCLALTDTLIFCLKASQLWYTCLRNTCLEARIITFTTVLKIQHIREGSFAQLVKNNCKYIYILNYATAYSSVYLCNSKNSMEQTVQICRKRSIFKLLSAINLFIFEITRKSSYISRTLQITRFVRYFPESVHQIHFLCLFATQYIIDFMCKPDCAYYFCYIKCP